MLKMALRLAKTALCISIALSPLILGGCDNPHRVADKQASEASAKLQADHLRAVTLDDLGKLAIAYENLAATANISDYTQVMLLNQAGQVHLQEAIMLRAGLRDNELAIFRSIAELQQLSSQVAAAQTYAKALAAHDPAALLNSNTQAQTDVKGAADKDTFAVNMNDQPKVLVATIAKLDANIDANTKALKDAHDKDAQLAEQRTHALAAAETLLTKSHNETGDALANDLIQSANKRRDAAVADAQRATLAWQMTCLQRQIDQDTSTKKPLTACAAALADQAQRLQATWQKVGEQIKAQQTLAQQIISGGFPTADEARNAKVSSVAQRAADLKARLDDADLVRADLLTQATKADQLYGKAASLAVSLRRDLVDQSHPQDVAGKFNIDWPIYADLSETLHPDYLKFDQAMAELIQASALASDQILRKSIADLLDGSPADVKAAEQAAKITADKSTFATDNANVDAIFEKAANLVANPASVAGENLELRQTAMQRLDAAINRQWATFDKFMGNTKAADLHNSTAQDRENELKLKEPSATPAAPQAPAAPAVPAVPTTAPSDAPPAT